MTGGLPCPTFVALADVEGLAAGIGNLPEDLTVAEGRVFTDDQFDQLLIEAMAARPAGAPPVGDVVTVASAAEGLVAVYLSDAPTCSCGECPQLADGSTLHLCALALDGEG